MSFDQFLDPFPLPGLFVSIILLLVFVIEVGFRRGMAHRPKSVKAQTAQVRAIMVANLGLLAFMLAFTFSTAQQHYETRVQHMVDEARIAGTAFLQADFLEEPTSTRAKALLYQYISDRLELQNLIKQDRVPEMMAIVIKAEDLQRELWGLLASPGSEGGAAVDPKARNEPFVNDIIGLIDVHNLRIQAALMNRIPVIVWLSLFFTAIMAMLVVGYQAGLTGKRTPIATYSLAVVFSAVMMLITDLDRPRMSMFEINNQIMINLHGKMGLELGHPPSD